MTGRGTVVLIVVVTAIIGLLEVVIGGHRGHLFGIAFALTSAIGALVVRRRDLPIAMIAPPLSYLFLIVLMLLSIGLNSVGIGILGEYLGRAYAEVKHRPLYIVQESVNLNTPPQEAGFRIEGS